MMPTLCLFCSQPVETITYPGHGTAWIHQDGYRECRPTYAAPNLLRRES